MTKYNTVNNLKKIWNHLDNALSEMNLAIEDCIELAGDNEKLNKMLLEVFDFSEIVNIKNEVEELIIEKGGEI